MSTSSRARPDPSEYSPFFHGYVTAVPDGDVVDLLRSGGDELLETIRRIPEERGGHRYGPDKWTIRQVASHVNDTERVFSFRAFWFGRGLEAPMPSFDQDIAIKVAGADDRNWQSHIDEFRAVRSATIAFFNALPADAWTRRGVASDNPVTVRALAYIVAGHAAHHARILREQYLRS